MTVLYIPDLKFNLTRLKQRVGEFTLYNGTWPETIIMEPQGYECYLTLAEEFCDITVRPREKDEILVRR